MDKETIFYDSNKIMTCEQFIDYYSISYKELKNRGFSKEDINFILFENHHFKNSVINSNEVVNCINIIISNNI